MQAASCFFFAWVSDKTRKRAIWLAVQNCICISGLVITTYTKSNPVRYFGLFIVDAGAVGCVPGVLAYVGYPLSQLFVLPDENWASELQQYEESY